MNDRTHRGQLRSTWVYAAFFVAFLHNVAFSDGPVCLDKGVKNDGNTAFVMFSPNGKWLAAQCRHEVLLWDFATKEKIATFNRPHEKAIDGIAFSPDSQRIACLDCTGRVCLWDGSAGWADAPEREILGPLIGPDGRQKTTGASAGENVAISPDGKLLAVPRGREVIKIIELDTGSEVGELGVPRAVDSMQFSDQGKVLVLGVAGTARKWPLVQFWNTETLTEEEPLRVQFPPHLPKRGCTLEAVMSPTEKVLALMLGGHNITGDVRLYELPTGRWTTLASNRRIMSFLSFSPDGRLLAMPTHHGPGDPAAVLVWDLVAKVWRRFDCPSEIAQKNVAFWNTKFSPDGRYLAGGLTHPDVAVCIWDLQAETDTSESD